jgi:hypothetical protein
MLKSIASILRSASALVLRYPHTRIISALALLGISVFMGTAIVNGSVATELDWTALIIALVALVGGVTGTVRELSEYNEGRALARRVKNVLTAALGDEFCDEVIGDLQEVFLREREVVGDFRARLRFRRALLTVIVRRFWRSVVRLALRGRA